jgi:hypothetical protein
MNLSQGFWPGKCPDDYSWLPINTCFAAASSFSFSLLTFGSWRLSASNVSMTAAATTVRVNHLLSAGTTYHGASGVEVSRIISWYAVMYVALT